MTDTNKTTKKALKITLIGSEGTGKSAFLAGLAVLGLDPMNPQYSLTPHNHTTSAYLNTLRESFIIHNAWPTPTLVTQLLDFDLTINQTKLNLVTIDYGGELFREAFNQMKPEDMQAFSDHLRQSEVLLFLVDAEEVVEAQNSGKQFALSEKLRANMTAVRESCKEFAKTNQDRFNEMELCIVLTKADRIPELAGAVEDSAIARAFGEKYFGKVLETKVDGIKTENIRYFAVSSIGKNALDPTSQALIPGKIQPEGYNNLFTWISKRGTRRFNRRLVFVVILLTIFAVFIGFFGFSGKVAVDELYEQSVKSALNILKDENRPFIERINAREVQRLISDAKIKAQRLQVFESRKKQLRSELEKSNTSKSIEELKERIRQDMEALQEETWKTDFQILLNECNQKMEECDFEEVKTLRDAKRDKECTESAYEFIRKYPKSEYKTKVQKILNDIQSEELRIARDAIAKIPNTKANLIAKSEKIRDFLKKYEDQVPSEAAQMRKAAEMGKAFAEKRQYRVKLKSFGGFNKSQWQRFVFKVEGEEKFRHKDESGMDLTIDGDETITFTWEYGDKIELIIPARFYSWSFHKWKDVAKASFENEEGLKCFSEGKIMLPATREEFKKKTSTGFFVKFEGSPYSEDDWKAFEAYFFPGNAWEQSKAKETK